MTDEQGFDRDKLAVALTYERGKGQAPVVAAKGKGYIAEQIITIAREHGVDVHSDADLARVLSAVDIGEPIPVEAYVAVAEILAYLYRTNARLKEKRGA